jgi:hypothetical protein
MYLPRPSHAEGMSDRYRPAVHIHLAMVNPQDIGASEGHNSECFIELPDGRKNYVDEDRGGGGGYQRSMSDTLRPCLARSFGTATVGPIPISSGSHPPTAKPTNAPSGVRPIQMKMIKYPS